MRAGIYTKPVRARGISAKSRRRGVINSSSRARTVLIGITRVIMERDYAPSVRAASLLCIGRAAETDLFFDAYTSGKLAGLR